MGKEFTDWGIKQKISMAERVGKIIKFMNETACVHVQERELIAYCKMYPLIVKGDTKFNEYLKTVGIPALTILGQGRWYRDTITDLGFALSGGTGKAQTEDTSKILDVKPK